MIAADHNLVDADKLKLKINEDGLNQRLDAINKSNDDSIAKWDKWYEENARKSGKSAGTTGRPSRGTVLGNQFSPGKVTSATGSI